MTLFTGVQHLCTFNIVASIFITFCQMVGRRRTPSARPSLLMLRIDRHIARISSSVVPGSSQWVFHFGEEIVIAWTQDKTTTLAGTEPIILNDNARSHTAATKDFLHRWQWEILENPPCSPDMCLYPLPPFISPLSHPLQLPHSFPLQYS